MFELYTISTKHDQTTLVNFGGKIADYQTSVNITYFS